MILEELKKLAEREHLLADEGYGPQKVHALIVTDREGGFHGLQSQMKLIARGKGKAREEPAWYPMPSPEGRRTSGDLANFLYDKSDYVFGVGDATPQKLANRRRLFRELVKEALVATNDEGVRAAARFLDRLDNGEFTIRLDEYPPGAVFAFQDLDDPGSRLSDRISIAGWWRSRRAAGGTEEGTCILCGRQGAVVRVHPEIKNVPNGNPAGVALVSFNAAAFTSFGFGDDDSFRNAPFCRECSDAYTRALNRLLSPGFPDPRNPGQTLPLGNYRLSSDTVAVFWSSDTSFNAFFGPALTGDPERVRDLFATPWVGAPSNRDTPRFFSLILSGAQGRAVLRSSFALTLEEVMGNLRRYFDDIELVPIYASEPPGLPLERIVRSLQAPGTRSTVPSILAQDLYEAAVRGRSYPRSLLDAALRRLRAGEDFSRARIAVIKAFLNRNNRNDDQWKEITMALDPDNKQPGYRLGRLFAVLERLQGDAINSPNATIVDRYFGAACATPAVVFPRLMKMAQHHASKSARGEWFQRQIQDVVNGLEARNAFPSTLPLEQQGLFSIGYYHQRADLFTSKKGEAASDAGSAPETRTKG